MEQVRLHDKVFEMYISSAAISEALENLARDIRNSVGEEEEILFLSVLNGSFIFAADLVRLVDRKCSISFVRVFSYEGVSSSGKIREVMGITDPIEGKNVIILEDIIDTGITIDYIYNRVKSFHPKSIKIATFLFKKEAYGGTLPVDFIGFSIPNDFVVGYGLDYDGLGRNLPHIYKLLKENEDV